MNQITAVVVKPEGLEIADDIIDILEIRGLIAVDQRPLRFTEEIMERLYGTQPADVRARLREQMLGKDGIVIKIEGEDAIEEVVRVTGQSYDSKKCHAGTIRAIYGCKEVGREHFNVVHRPKTPEEVEICLNLVEWETD